ncbi:GIY-YIG nuclease family protein [Maritalea porphyrae]|uniref:GIY-YIG nuclease family protein n=1 Tax=Maritalea porphyrae TaxID=880732 RepID=UPI0022AEB6AF|nr:GIY-YIG nuclease family protein [Maritalea porphyrae]MCZ4271449.1 GIY-YIG nuclease family protein [Maritalea porphyrae]
MSGWVYIMTNKPRGTLYVGVTNNLPRRVWEHREGVVDGFTKSHSLKMLVYMEEHATMPLAIQREKNIKHWLRKWKIDLIEGRNPKWDDLFDQLA